MPWAGAARGPPGNGVAARQWRGGGRRKWGPTSLPAPTVPPRLIVRPGWARRPRRAASKHDDSQTGVRNAVSLQGPSGARALSGSPSAPRRGRSPIGSPAGPGDRNPRPGRCVRTEARSRIRTASPEPGVPFVRPDLPRPEPEKIPGASPSLPSAFARASPSRPHTAASSAAPPCVSVAASGGTATFPFGPWPGRLSAVAGRSSVPRRESCHGWRVAPSGFHLWKRRITGISQAHPRPGRDRRRGPYGGI